MLDVNDILSYAILVNETVLFPSNSFFPSSLGSLLLNGKREREKCTVIFVYL